MAVPAGLRRLFPRIGAVMLLIPLVVPRAAAAYLFGLVWMGFIFLLDPLNARLRATSLERELARGQRGRLYALLVSGAVCGIFWEFWNYWSPAKWIYVFPIFSSVKIFEMPVVGYFGFPPFAVEYFCLHVFVVAAAQRMGLFRGLGRASEF